MVEGSGSRFVSPTGYIELDNDCQYSIDTKSTRSREYINPKEDLSFYFNTYIVPKYGLENINVSNVASFMKDLEMNWTKLTPDLKDKVLDIMVDGIFKTGNYDFKNRLLQKLNISTPPSPPPPNVTGDSKSNFGQDTNNLLIMLLVIIFVVSLMVYLKYFS